MRFLAFIVVCAFACTPVFSQQKQETQDAIFEFAEEGNLAEFRKIAHHGEPATLALSLQTAAMKGYRHLTKYLLENHPFSQFSLDLALRDANLQGHEHIVHLLKSFGAKQKTSQPKEQPVWGGWMPWIVTGGILSATTGLIYLAHYVRQHQRMDDCVICTDEMTRANSLVLPCNHRFHTVCLKQLLQASFFDHRIEAISDAAGVVLPQVAHDIVKYTTGDARFQMIDSKLRGESFSDSDYLNRIALFLVTGICRILPGTSPVLLYMFIQRKFVCPLCRGPIAQGDYRPL